MFSLKLYMLPNPRSHIIGCDTCVRDYNSVVMTSISSFISSIERKVNSIVRRVHKSLECVPRGFGAWGAELAMFGRHFTSWGKRNHVKTLIS
jgi:secreted trypsin-like serine protease